MVNFGVTGGQFWESLGHNYKRFRAINLKLGTGTCIGSAKIPIYFGVMEINLGVTGVNFRSLENNLRSSKTFTAIKLKCGIDLPERPLRKPKLF